MPNTRRGEIAATLDGTPFTLVLTLGALAELEQAFGDEDMLSLAERFQAGRLSALDAQRIIGAGLRGAGHQILDEAVGRMRAEGGAAGFVDIVARLLAATFGEAEPRPAPESPSPLRGAARGGGDNERGPESGSPAAPARQEGEAAAPFPGTM